MEKSVGEGVRPTRRCLDALGVKPPTIDVPLDALPDPVVKRAQQLPALWTNGGVERIACVSDRALFKVKSSNRRAAGLYLRERPDCHCATESRRVPPSLGAWWLVAAGQRRQDTPSQDFYERLGVECRSGSGHLQPCTWDWKRLLAEISHAAVVMVQRDVRKAAWMSMTRGSAVQRDGDGWAITVLLRAQGHEAYLLVGGSGIHDAQTLALLLSSFPEIAADDWQPEPGGIAGIEPGAGEIVWSTYLAADVQTALLEEFDDEASWLL